nr:collagen alpha-2(V) chain-like [Aedes albopictus]
MVEFQFDHWFSSKDSDPSTLLRQLAVGLRIIWTHVRGYTTPYVGAPSNRKSEGDRHGRADLGVVGKKPAIWSIPSGSRDAVQPEAGMGPAWTGRPRRRQDDGSSRNRNPKTTGNGGDLGPLGFPGSERTPGGPPGPLGLSWDPSDKSYHKTILQTTTNHRRAEPHHHGTTKPQNYQYPGPPGLAGTTSTLKSGLPSNRKPEEDRHGRADLGVVGKKPAIRSIPSGSRGRRPTGSRQGTGMDGSTSAPAGQWKQQKPKPENYRRAPRTPRATDIRAESPPSTPTPSNHQKPRPSPVEPPKKPALDFGSPRSTRSWAPRASRNSGTRAVRPTPSDHPPTLRPTNTPHNLDQPGRKKLSFGPPDTGSLHSTRSWAPRPSRIPRDPSGKPHPKRPSPTRPQPRPAWSEEPDAARPQDPSS